MQIKLLQRTTASLVMGAALCAALVSAYLVHAAPGGPSSPGAPIGNFNFRVEIDGASVGTFTEISGLSAEIEMIEVREGGDSGTTRKIPGRPKYGNITLKRGVIGDDMLWEWFAIHAEGGIERKNGSIVILNQTGAEVARYNFLEAWPAKWEGPTYDSSSRGMAIEKIELAVEKIERVGR